MPSFTDILVVIGMIGLRFGVPTLILAAMVYGLKRLDRRWEAEARDYAAKHPEARPAVQPTAPQPAAPARMPAKTPALPFVIPPAVKDQRIQPGMSAQQGVAMPAPRSTSVPVQPGLSAAGHQACWNMKDCSDATKAQCAAPKHPDQPCWQARFDAEGQIPEECVKCDVFQRYPMM